ncbi:hypothetical protein QQS21_009588 [Conoideocrella luteorostrata]|uniref:Rab-GAP TBC domain-containing protein n=1 Tax=Conoideocrella luteorostrata TaxID=1105319 RepID=A0AAJ0CIZ5_9HYPO|nr:hypothetical protein QQS21_009588 [Conoideocrella luteorostrata]
MQLSIHTVSRNKTSQSPDVSSLRASPLWDSPSHGSHLLYQSPFPGSSSPQSVHTEETPSHDPQSVATIAVSPIIRRHCSVRTSASESCDTSPSRLIQGTPSLPRSCSPKDIPAFENFSKPRNRTTRQVVRPHNLRRSISDISRPGHMHDSTKCFVAPASPSSQLYLCQQPTSPSAFSVKSCSACISTHLGNEEPAEPKRHRAGDALDSSTLAPYSIPVDLKYPEDPFPAFLAGYGSDRTASWMSGDELRSGVRPQLSSSSIPCTAVTEHSSVLAEDCPVTPKNTDEASLLDVLALYEEGFADDEDGNVLKFDRRKSGENLASKPISAINLSELDGQLFPADSSGDATVPFVECFIESPLRANHSTTDAENSQSITTDNDTATCPSVIAMNKKVVTCRPQKPVPAKSLDPEASIEYPTTGAIETAKTALSTRFGLNPSPFIVAPALEQPVFMPVEPENFGLRDRYGFKKANQYIDGKQYDVWNAEYSIYMARRRSKWVIYLQDCALLTDRPVQFPPPSAKTKKFVRKGIPPDWRGAAWFYYAGGPEILARQAGVYESLLEKPTKRADVEAIERDLYRTFPENIHFDPSPRFESIVPSAETGQATTHGFSDDESISRPRSATLSEPPVITSLRRVLHAFSVYHPSVGYCQGLNFLAGLLLLFMETEEQCFWLLTVITIEYFPETHNRGLEGSRVDLGVVMAELREKMPSIWDKVGSDIEHPSADKSSTSRYLREATQKLAEFFHRRKQPNICTDRLPPITLCMTAWFMSCYIGTLPIETTLRVWDVLFYEGSKTVFQVALAILKSGESEINAVNDPMEMLGVVQAMPRRMLDPNTLMKTCFKRRTGFEYLSQGAIDKRRQEVRETGI